MSTPRRRSEQLPTHRDPITTAPGNPSTSPLLGPTTPQFERGVILEVDARRHSYRVTLNSGRVFTMGRLRTSPGDRALLDRGMNVLVAMGMGEPYIFGILPLGSAHTDTGPSVSDIDGHGGDDPVLDRGLAVNARDPEAPRDLLPGDEALCGPDGAMISALRGKVAQLVGGPLAKIQAFGETDKVAITAGELRINTWAGELEHTNHEGRTNVRWRSGSDQTTQTGADEGRFTVALDVGAEGDVIRLELTNREGQALFRVHVDANGRAEVFAAGGIVRSGGDGPGSIEETSHHGSSAHETTGDRENRVGGNRKDTTGGAWQAVVAGLLELVAGTDLSLLGANSILVRAGGPALVSATEDATFAGRNIRMDPRTGLFTIDTAIPDAIVCGSGAVSHGVKYEELVPLLAAIISRLNGLSASVALHTHSVLLGPPRSLPSETLTRYLTPFTLDFTPARSQVLRLL